MMDDATLSIIHEIYPPQKSHHQDYETILVGDPNQNLYLPLLLVGGRCFTIHFVVLSQVLYIDMRDFFLGGLDALKT